MDIVGWLAWLAAALGTSTALPQLIKIWRTRVTTGVSTKLWQLSLSASIAWTFHGAWTSQVALAGATATLFVLQAGVLVLVCNYEGLNKVPRFVGPSLLSLVFIVLDVLFGPLLFGALVVVCPLLGQVAQLRTMVRAADLRGVSKEYLLLNLLANALWFCYGVVEVEWAMRLSSGAQLVACTLVLGYFYYRRIMLVRAVPSVTIRTAA